MTIQTGYTPEPTQAQRISNLMAIISESAASLSYINDAVNFSGGDLNEFERALTGHAMAIINMQMESPALFENNIRAALKGGDLTSNERAELWAELAEIHNWLTKDENQISDYADAQRCARFGTQL